MEKSALQRLVSQGEGQHLEFKRKINFIEKILKEVVAFSNTDGGTLLIGVNDNGEIHGLKFPDDEAIIFEDALTRYCSPTIGFDREMIPWENGRTILKYDFPPGVAKPYYLIEQHDHARKMPYVRINDKSIRASHEVLEILRLRDSERSYSLRMGDREKILLTHLEQYGHITLDEFQHIADLPRSEASEILINMVMTGVIHILPDGTGDRYLRKNNDDHPSDSSNYLLI
jgi:hypothetical protein